jgi:site-specific recombinase XerD
MKDDTTGIAKFISDYLYFLIDRKYSSSTIDAYESVLGHFKAFLCGHHVDIHHIADQNILNSFYQTIQLPDAHKAINGFIQFLKHKNLVNFAITWPDDLHPVFADYFNYYQRIGQANTNSQRYLRKILKEFNDFLLKNQVSINDLNIRIVDSFLDETKSKKLLKSNKYYRSALRGFLKFLHHECGISDKDLSSQLVIAPVFNQSNPPKFLRHSEIKKLLGATSLSTAKDLRTNAIVRLAISSGLRPIEISKISLDDIHFKAGELTLPVRKGRNPVTFPLPESTIKAIVAYMIGGRPQIDERRLFVAIHKPYLPVSSDLIQESIRELMRKANVPGTPYYLRHTFAQNLLESGASILDIKEMLGHDSIKTTKKYLHIDMQLMREVLFDE